MIELRKSEIHGTGVFATEIIPEGTIIGRWCTKEPKYGIRYLYQDGMECKWYETGILGRYCNHKLIANTKPIMNDSEILLMSIHISKGEEILVNYNWVTELIGYKIDTTSID